MAPATEDTVSP